MKSLRIPLWVIATIVLFLISCTNQRSEELLTRAVKYADSAPDTSLMLLDSINPGQLSKQSEMWYHVNRVRVKYKLYQDITSDTLIFRAVDYFRKRSNHERQMYALFYAGSVYREQGNNQKAMQAYLNAADLAKRNKNESFRGLIMHNIGDLYYREANYDEALNYYNKSVDIYEDINSEFPRYITSLNSTAATLLALYKNDEALKYFDKAITVAESNNSEFLKSLVLNNIGFAFYQNKNYDHAKNFFLKSLSLETSEESKLRIYFNLAKIYSIQSKHDSVNFYLSKLESGVGNLKDYLQKANFYLLKYNVLFDQGKFQEADKINRRYIQLMDTIYRSSTDQAILEVQKKYDLSQKENELAKEQEAKRVFMLLSIITSLLAIIGFLIYLNINRRNKVLSTQKEHSQFINEMFVNSIINANKLEEESERISIKYGVKEKTDGYMKLQKLLHGVKSETKQSMADLAFTFLHSKFNEDVRSKFSAGEATYLALYHCNYPKEKMGHLLNCDNQALRLKKHRIRKKLENLGVSDREIEQKWFKIESK